MASFSYGEKMGLGGKKGLDRKFPDVKLQVFNLGENACFCLYSIGY